MMITQERLKEVLRYEPDTGNFIWLISPRFNVPIGTIAGSENSVGYINIRIDTKLYPAHRLAWLYMTGSFPNQDLDHIDRVRTNNKWSNLREATDSQNYLNTAKRHQNKSGFKGVSWKKRNRKWQVQLCGDYLGLFSDIREAALAYNKEALARFGEFAELNDV